ncbi:MAG: ATP-binding cassette domain-containing protein [Candidatus Kapaibacteriales bacterium]
MINVSNITLQFGKRILFKDVNIKFTTGNCYGLIGANGAGKSTFLKLLSKDIDPTTGQIIFEPNKRMAVLEQDQFKYDNLKVLDTVIRGHKQLYTIMKEREELYSKSEYTEEEGIRIGEIEAEFAEMNGYESESDAAQLLAGLGIGDEFHNKSMKDLESGEKVKVLIAQALFGNPDILLMDEPTNNLDMKATEWLENFLYNFNNLVIVVSHDRHFLNNVCTNIADIDYQQINMYSGNYEFWYQASQLASKQKRDQNKKSEDKIKELQEFIQRFSANASKSKQATARKKMIDKLSVESMPHSSRRFPYVEFKQDREVGNIILNVENLSYIDEEGNTLFSDVNFTVNDKDKIVFVSENDVAVSALFDILMGEIKPNTGEFNWGVTVTNSYIPKENSEYFSSELNLIDWLRQYSKDKEETFIRTFLGRMLFSGEETLKMSTVLSGGEKVRCMLSKTMCSGANVLVLDDPTNHLDLEAITSLNDAMIKYQGVLLFASSDHELISSTANRVIELTPNGMIDKMLPYDEYRKDEEVAKRKEELYGYAIEA